MFKRSLFHLLNKDYMLDSANNPRSGTLFDPDIKCGDLDDIYDADRDWDDFNSFQRNDSLNKGTNSDDGNDFEETAQLLDLNSDKYPNNFPYGKSDSRSSFDSIAKYRSSYLGDNFFDVEKEVGNSYSQEYLPTYPYLSDIDTHSAGNNSSKEDSQVIDMFPQDLYTDMKSGINITIEPGDLIEPSEHIEYTSTINSIYRKPVCLILGQRGVGKTTLYENLMQIYSKKDPDYVDGGKYARSNPLSIMNLKMTSHSDIIMLDKDGLDLVNAMKEYVTYLCDIVILMVDNTNSSTYQDIYRTIYNLQKDHVPFIVIINTEAISDTTTIDCIDDIEKILFAHSMRCRIWNSDDLSTENQSPLADDTVPILIMDCCQLKDYTEENYRDTAEIINLIDIYCQNKLYTTLLKTSEPDGIILNVQTRNDTCADGTTNQAIFVLLLNGKLAVGDNILININNEACIMPIRKIWIYDEDNTDDVLVPVQEISGTDLIFLQTEDDVDLFNLKIELESNIKAVKQEDITRMNYLYRNIRNIGNSYLRKNLYTDYYGRSTNESPPSYNMDVHSKRMNSSQRDDQGTQTLPKDTPTVETKEYKGYKGVYLKASSLTMLKALYEYAESHELTVMDSGLDSVLIEDIKDLLYLEQLKAIIALDVDVSPLVVEYIKNTNINIFIAKSISELHLHMSLFLTESEEPDGFSN